MKAALAALALAAPLAAAAAQETAVYRDPGHRFSITLPAGWSAMPDSQFREYRRRNLSDTTLFSALFSGAAPGSRYPYALLQVFTSLPMDPESFAASLNRERSDTGRVSAATGEPRIITTYDRSADLVRSAGVDSATDGVERFYEGIRMTGFGFVALTATGLAKDSAATLAALDSLAAGLAVDPPYRYRRGRRNGGLETLGALAFLALAGLVVGTFRVIGQRQVESGGAPRDAAGPTT